MAVVTEAARAAAGGTESEAEDEGAEVTAGAAAKAAEKKGETLGECNIGLGVYSCCHRGNDSELGKSRNVQN
jgi:hypothetical protein